MKLPCPECGMRPHLARRVEFSKGAKKSRKSMLSLQNDPQRVFVEFDRGKVSIAAAAEPYRKAEKLHGEMMVLVARYAEQAVLAEGGSNPVESEWQELLTRIRKRDFRKKIPQWIGIGILCLIIAGVILLVAMF